MVEDPVVTIGIIVSLFVDRDVVIAVVAVWVLVLLLCIIGATIRLFIVDIEVGEYCLTACAGLNKVLLVVIA